MFVFLFNIRFLIFITCGMEIFLKELKGKRVHFIGIGGISMSALAQMLEREGVIVQGSDLAYNEETEKLEKQNIKVFHTQQKENLVGVDVVVFSSAIHDDNEELSYAKSKNLMILKRAEILGIIAKDYKTVIAIAGSHGKTTTSAMISEIFLTAGKKPTIHVGGVLSKIKSNYKLGGKKYFITEACEYMDNYLYLTPDLSVILNIDSDHLDYFGSLDGVKKSFAKFARKVKKGGLNVLSMDDVNSLDIIDENAATFGMNHKADIYASNIKEYKPCRFMFDVIFCGCNLGNIKLSILGKHNISNALASILVSLACGIDFCDIKFALEHFSGVKRRSEIVSNKNNILVIHDYAHHPKQIEKMIDVAKMLTRPVHGKIIVAFEPHTYSRTKFLLDDFAKSFYGADYLFLAPVYSAREDESQGVGSDELALHTKKYVKKIECVSFYNDIKSKIKSIAKPHDVVLILGAGNIEKLAEKFRK